MHLTSRKLLLLGLLASFACLVSEEAIEVSQAQPLEFHVAIDPRLNEPPRTGRLYVFLTQRKEEPRFGPDWFNPEPFFGIDVKNFKTGELYALDSQNADGFPGPISELKPGRYKVQALLDHDFYHQNPSQGSGNLYSDESSLNIDPQRTGVVYLTLRNRIPEPPSIDTPTRKEIARKSELLSQFHRREVLEFATVHLPPNYLQQPQRRYPVLYIIPGFGGDHRVPIGVWNNERNFDFICVMLSGNCKWGHHVYADGPTNGPRGTALVREMVPYIDANFRTIAEPHARLITGHSSGGWSSLWVQVTHPDVFGGVWSTAPDPVDFRDYQNVNLYANPPLSLYFDPQGNARPIARRGDKPVLWYANFGKMDDVLKRGGQLRSFEAVFSPLDDELQPQKMWDRETGDVNPRVVEAWKAYDIRLKIQNNWSTLQDKLAGKLHIVMGTLDTFYLNGAVDQLSGTLEQLGSDAQIDIVPGGSHSSIMSAERVARMKREMEATVSRGPRQDTQRERSSALRGRNAP